MRSRLFAEKNIDYKRGVELALALEAAERHASVVGAPAVGLSGGAPAKDEGLHRVGGGGGGTARARQAAPAPVGAAAAARQLCSRCGKPGHVPGRCRYRFYSCDKCGEKDI